MPGFGEMGDAESLTSRRLVRPIDYAVGRKLGELKIG